MSYWSSFFARRLKRLLASALRVCLWGQRRHWPVPSAVRDILRRVLARSIEQSTGTEDWRSPLIHGRPRADLPRVLLDEPIVDRAGLEIEDPCNNKSCVTRSSIGERLRCVVATGVLDVGGLDRVAALLARRLPIYGINTTIVYPRSPAGFEGAGERLADTLRSEGVDVVKVPAQEAEHWLKMSSPDVMSLHGAPEWLVDAATKIGIPVIETLHGSHSLFDRASWSAEKFRSRRIDGVVAVSDLVRRQYLRANPDYSPDRIVTIPNGVDDRYIVHRDRTEARSWLGLRDEFLFVSLARYHLQKNVFGLVAAFSDVARRHPDAHLLIGGHVHDPMYFEQVRQLRDELGCAGQIHLRGHCAEASAVLAASDGFVLNSFFEGWPLCSMEALFAGVPVVMSEVGGAIEQVGEDGSRGFVVANPIGDAEAIDWQRMSQMRFAPQVNRAALAEAMSSLVAKRDHWKNARESLKAESVKRFSAEACVRSHAKVLIRAAAGKQIAPPGSLATLAM
jgi:glycosyltransferase involved in cell wall biosynthesis